MDVEAVMDAPDFEMLMIGANYIKAHPQAPSPERKPDHSPHKRRLNSKLHLAVDSHAIRSGWR